MHRRRQDLVVAVHVAERELDPGEDVPRLPVGHLVGQLDELAGADGLAHVGLSRRRSEDRGAEDPEIVSIKRVLKLLDKTAKSNRLAVS